MLTRAARPLIIAWIALGFFIITARPFAIELDGLYRGALVTIRPFMSNYSIVILVAQLVVLVLALVAALHASARGATLLLLLGVLGVVAFLLAPVLVGSGPFEPRAPQLAFYRVLIFATPLVRDLGLAAVSMSLVSARVRPVIAFFALLDAAVIALAWHMTPIAALATLHPATIVWPKLLPLAIIAILALAGAKKHAMIAAP